MPLDTHVQTILNDPRWNRIVTRDKTADGQFWYAVATSGVYCRPSCPSRQANPKNVSFYDSLPAAQASGFRACKRCHPDGLSNDTNTHSVIEKACRLIDGAESPPRLADLAAFAHLSPSHFHRVFKAIVGITPAAYAQQRRAERLRAGLSTAASVTAAAYDAGFNNPSPFYATAQQTLGMSPRRYRAGGVAEVLRYAVANCWLGRVLVATSLQGVVAILLGEADEALCDDLYRRFPKATIVAGEADYTALVHQVVSLIDHTVADHPLPLDIRGTAFQRRVWQALRDIPPGATASYTAIAESLGTPKAVRAVAGACAANPLAVAVPCHRVVRGDGSLAGYRWGLERKRALLRREGAIS